MDRRISNKHAGLMTMNVFGLKDLQDQLLAIGAVAGLKVLVRAARKALLPVLLDAQSKVPVDSGLLRDSLAITIKKPKKGPAVLVAGLKIKVGKGGAKSDIKRIASQFPNKHDRIRARWHFVEFGTVDQPARPFIRPAFEGNWQQTVGLLRTELAAELAKELKKRARKARKKAA